MSFSTDKEIDSLFSGIDKIKIAANESPHRRNNSVDSSHLLPGWVKKFDSNYDKCYYVNTRKNIVTFSSSVALKDSSQVTDSGDAETKSTPLANKKSGTNKEFRAPTKKNDKKDENTFTRISSGNNNREVLVIAGDHDDDDGLMKKSTTNTKQKSTKKKATSNLRPETSSAPAADQQEYCEIDDNLLYTYKDHFEVDSIKQITVEDDGVCYDSIYTTTDELPYDNVANVTGGDQEHVYQDASSAAAKTGSEDEINKKSQSSLSRKLSDQTIVNDDNENSQRELMQFPNTAISKLFLEDFDDLIFLSSLFPPTKRSEKIVGSSKENLNKSRLDIQGKLNVEDRQLLNTCEKEFTTMSNELLRQAHDAIGKITKQHALKRKIARKNSVWALSYMEAAFAEEISQAWADMLPVHQKKINQLEAYLLKQRIALAVKFIGIKKDVEIETLLKFQELELKEANKCELQESIDQEKIHKQELTDLKKKIKKEKPKGFPKEELYKSLEQETDHVKSQQEASVASLKHGQQARMASLKANYQSHLEQVEVFYQQQILNAKDLYKDVLSVDL